MAVLFLHREQILKLFPHNIIRNKDNKRNYNKNKNNYSNSNNNFNCNNNNNYNFIKFRIKDNIEVVLVQLEN